MKFSPQQEAVFTVVRSPRPVNVIVESVAGSGKTTTGVNICEIFATLNPRASIAFVAFNKPVSLEIGAKTAHLPKVRAGTFHSFGYQAWSKHIGAYLKPTDKKVKTLVTAIERALPEVEHEFIIRLVSLAKQSAFGVAAPIEACDWRGLVDHFDVAETLPDYYTDIDLDAAIGRAREILVASNNVGRTEIDFDDQIYLPLVFNARMWQNDLVIVDEAQDTNAARRMLIKKMLRPGGRLVAVGDPHQAIYGFTGANNDALDLIAKEFNCRRMPLTVSYRCPQAVVAHARQIVSHILAADSAPLGSVATTTRAAFDRLGAVDLAPGMAVLCRNTAPLVEAAFGMIRRGIGVRIEGRDIGAGLMALAFRWKSVKSLVTLRARLADYCSRETQKLLAKGQEMKAASVEDRVNAVLAIMDGLPADADLATLRNQILKMFGDTPAGEAAPTVVLSTVHKSKGREWDRVYLLGRNIFMPSRYARQAWQEEQELNLIYVAITRAKSELIEVTYEEKRR